MKEEVYKIQCEDDEGNVPFIFVNVFLYED